MTQNSKPNKRKRDYAAEYKARMEKAKAETGKSYNSNRRKAKAPRSTPTGDTYLAFQQAFEYFNRELFDGELPDCMITLRTFGKARGYFKADSFADMATVTTVHEIAMDPRQFIERSSVEILSTLVHEMCHLWQMENGKPSRNGYHNREWANRMAEVGLIASDTAAEGGKTTGQKVSHYIETGGRFEKSATKLVATGSFKAAWVDLEGFQLKAPVKGGPAKLTKVRKSKTTKSGRRSKYTCPACANSVWGKDGLFIACGGTEVEQHDPMVMLQA